MTVAPRPSSKQSQFMPFKPSWLNKLRSPLQSAGYYVLLSRSAQAFLDRLSPYQKMALSQKLYSLAGNPRSDKARHMKNTTDKYYIPEENTGFSITYEVLSGKVYVTGIVPDLSAMGIHKEVPALYHVKQSPAGVWTAEKLKNSNIKTRHAAVNGQSNPLREATTIMQAHVRHAYGRNINEFTLFHNPSDGMLWDTYESLQDKIGLTTGVTMQFTNTLRKVQEGNQQVSWVAHSQGGIIFTQAVKHHLDNGGASLGKNSVQFNAGANNRHITARILARADIMIRGFNNNPYDLVPKFGANDLTPSKVVGSILHIGYLFWGTPARSPHTLPYDGKLNYQKNMPGIYRALYKII